MTSVAEGIPMEDDSFNSSSYFDRLKLNSSHNKSWVELMEEEEMEEECSRSPWASLTKTECSAREAKADAAPDVDVKENLGTAEVPAVIDRKPASPVHIKQEVESDEEATSSEETEEYEQNGGAVSTKCEEQVKQEPCDAKVKIEGESAWASGDHCSRSTSCDGEEVKYGQVRDEEPVSSLSSSRDVHKRKHRSEERERESRHSKPSLDEKKESRGQSIRDQNPAELLFNFDSARKRRHPRKTSDRGSETSKRGTRHWDFEDSVKKQRRDQPYRDSSTSSSQSSLNKKQRKVVEYEKDPAVIARRQKQIDYGKNTVGYDNYVKQVPKFSRTRHHPRTPPKYMKYSRRAWDGMVKIWRQQLHLWDSPSDNTSGEFSEALKDDKSENWDINSEDGGKKEDVLSWLSEAIGTEDPLDTDA